MKATLSLNANNHSSSACDINSNKNVIYKKDILDALVELKDESIDLCIADPPYNLNKKFNSTSFNKQTSENYKKFLEPWIKEVYRVIKNEGSFYICCDWYSSNDVCNIIKKYFIVQNRITWKRDKGRASKKNYKNNSEDIYFCSKTSSYLYNPIKIKKKVIAPYKLDGKERDWFEENGKAYRYTAVGNFMDNITIPFWSMKENTIHPTQKPEKLMAKLILASSKKDNLILDLFSGSGTTSVVAKKLNRNSIAIESDDNYCQIIEERLTKANVDKMIQGFNGKAFLERNV